MLEYRVLWAARSARWQDQQEQLAHKDKRGWPQGPQGNPGPAGAIGPQGEQGEAGPQGPQENLVVGSYSDVNNTPFTYDPVNKLIYSVLANATGENSFAVNQGTTSGVKSFLLVCKM